MPRKYKGKENLRLDIFRKKYNRIKCSENYSDRYYKEWVEDEYFELKDKYDKLLGDLKQIVKQESKENE